MAFYKFNDSKDVNKFCGGSMQFRRLEYYRTLEEKEKTGRADENDGLLVSDSCVLPSGIPVRVKLKMERKNNFRKEIYNISASSIWRFRMSRL